MSGSHKARKAVRRTTNQPSRRIRRLTRKLFALLDQVRVTTQDYKGPWVVFTSPTAYEDYKKSL